MREKITSGSYTLTVENGVLLRCTAPENCTEDLIIPEGIVSVGQGILVGLSAVSTVVLPSSVVEIQERSFDWKSSLKHVVFPKNLRKIGANAFTQSGLLSLDLPDSLTEIGESAFYGCSITGELRLPKNLHTIRDKAFASNFRMTALKLPQGLTSIGTSAFSRCFELTSVTIPSSVKRIGMNAFSFCKNLKEIVFEGTDFVLDAEIFDGIQGEISITYPGTGSQIEALLNADCVVTESERDSYYGEPIYVTHTRHASPIGHYSGKDYFTCKIHCLADGTTKTYSCTERGPVCGRPTLSPI